MGPWEFAQPPRASLSLSCKMGPLEESEGERKHWARGLLGIWSAHQYFLRVCVRMCLLHRGMEWNGATGFHFSSPLSVVSGDGTRSTPHLPEEFISRLVTCPVFLACQVACPLECMQFLTSGFLSNSDPRQESVGRIGTRQGRGPAYLGPRVPSDQTLQDQGVALPDGVDSLADIILLHHTGLPCVHNLGLGWSCGERTE